jgi:hypothetical protein
MQLAQAQGSPSGNTGAVNHGNTMQGTGVNQRQSPSASSSYSSLFQQYRGNLGPREGGIANRPKTADPGGLTNKGMSQKELDRLRQIRAGQIYQRVQRNLQIHKLMRFFMRNTLSALKLRNLQMCQAFPQPLQN